MGQDTRVLASPTTPFACLVEREQVSVLGGPSGLAPLAEVGLAAGSDVAVVGDHLAVLAPTGQLYVVDPRGDRGPVVVAELALAPASRLAATTTNHALVMIGDGSAVIEITNRGHTTCARLPPRVRLDRCAASGLPDQFLIACGDVIEEWSAISRAPVRRFHLDRPIAEGWIGGTPRHVWAVTDDELVAIKRDGTSRPSRIALPEPVALAVGDGLGAVAIIGATSRRAWIVRIGDRTITPLCEGPIGDLALGRDAAVILGDDGTPAQIPYGANKPLVIAVPRVRAIGRRDIEPPGDWRDELVAWMKRSAPPAQLPACTPVRDVAARLAIDARDIGVLFACYAARLCGHDGATFADLVEHTPGRWTEVLGRGSLRASGAFVWHGARVHLAPEVVALLDEHAPIHGHVYEGMHTRATVRRIVAPAGIDLDAIAAWAAPTLGALLVPNARGVREPSRFLLEARARDIAPLVAWRRAAWPHLDHAVVVVDDARVATELGPVALTWAIAAAA
jgi:hypothetical protein